MFLQWLVAHDFDSCSDAAAVAACQIADGQARAIHGRGRVVLCHVVVDAPLIITPDVMGLTDLRGELAARHEEAAQRLERVAVGLRTRFPTLTVESCIGRGPTVATILDEAERAHVDAVACGTHGSHGLTRLLFGSTAERAVHGSRKPVLVVKNEAPPLMGS